MKLMGFDRGVTLLGGFPLPICTPAHGTAYDIAGQGIANIGATRVAILLAAEMAASDAELQLQHHCERGTAPLTSYGGPSASMERASAWARGTMVSSSRYSSGLWALPPQGPVAQRVGAPIAAANPESAQPPVNSPPISEPDAVCASNIKFE
jgi:hypothetical protein